MCGVKGKGAFAEVRRDSPEALLAFFRFQPKHSKSLWSVERRTHRGLPDNFNPVRRRPLTTKQIDSKPVSNCRRVAL